MLVASPASAHPLGTPPALIIRASPTGLSVAWVTAPDDARALADHLGLGPVLLTSLHEHASFRDYFTRRLTFIAGGSACRATILPVREAGGAISFEATYECGGPVGTIEVRLRLLQDIDDRYQTIFQAATRAGISRGVLNVATPRATIDFATGTSEPASDGSREQPASLPARITAALQGQQGAAPFVVALLLAFVVGAVHALTPGHGKTLTAAYLVGTGGTVRHAVGLGAIVAGTHAVATGSIGAAAIAADRLVLPGQLGPYLELAAGALIVALAWTIWRARPHRHDDQSTIAATLGFKRLALIGFVGGLIPSPDAIAIVLVAFSLERWTAGAALIAAFSLGLAAVVLAVAVLAVKGAPLVRRIGGGRLMRHAPVLVAALFVIVGLVLAAGGIRKI